MLYDMTIGGKLNENTVVVVSDIHGQIVHLDNLLDQVIGTDAQMVFVGDYIDRGEHGIEVLTRVRSLCERPHEWGLTKVTALLGNHEKMALDAVDDVLLDTYDTSNTQLWLRNGGRIEEFMAIAHDFYGWLRSLPLYYKHNTKVSWRGEAKKLFVAHASVQPRVPAHTIPFDTLVWDRQRVGYGEDYLTVTGHTMCKLGQPEVYHTSSGTLVRIDTGAAVGDDIAGLVLEGVDG
jgi:serine/threonine protein phosphatase 1